MINRRGFLGSMAAFAAAVTLDPERLLWVPGQKTIFLPAPNQFVYPDWLAAEILKKLSNNLAYVRSINTEYGTAFASVMVRRPQRFH